MDLATTTRRLHALSCQHPEADQARLEEAVTGELIARHRASHDGALATHQCDAIREHVRDASREIIWTEDDA